MRITLVALGACAVLALAGCASESTTTSPSPTLSRPTSAPPSAPVPFGTHHVGPETEIPAAEVAGTLVLADGCLLVESGEGQEHPLVLPDVAVWDEQAQEVTIHGVSYALGDEVWWAGAYGSHGGIPSSCPTDDQTATVYETS